MLNRKQYEVIWAVVATICGCKDRDPKVFSLIKAFCLSEEKIYIEISGGKKVIVFLNENGLGIKAIAPRSNGYMEYVFFPEEGGKSIYDPGKFVQGEYEIILPEEMIQVPKDIEFILILLERHHRSIPDPFIWKDENIKGWEYKDEITIVRFSTYNSKVSSTVEVLWNLRGKEVWPVNMTVKTTGLDEKVYTFSQTDRGWLQK